MWRCIKLHLNFYRIHLLLFTLIPLICAVVFWASNGEYKIAFVDGLYVCISGVTGTGLQTIDLSLLTVFQQVIVAFLELIGNQAFVAWIVVLVRRRYFLEKLEHIVSAEHDRKTSRVPTQDVIHGPEQQEKQEQTSANGTSYILTMRSRPTKPLKIHTGMVRRTDVTPHLITPMGFRSIPPSPALEPADRNLARVLLPEHSSQAAQATGVDLPRVASRRSSLRAETPPPAMPPAGFGGFPGFYDLISGTSRRIFPSLHRRINRTMTMPRTATLLPAGDRSSSHILQTPAENTRTVPYISFRAIVGRNSRFHGLTDENKKELGGVEFSALTNLMWLVPLYYFGLLAMSFVVVAPYMNLSSWRLNFLPPQQHKLINPTWYSAFQVIGGWANTGMSLVDQGMVPFRTAYPLVIFLVFCVLAGNTLFPVFFRWVIWGIAKLLPKKSHTRASLRFLLDHPRRCFIYMFPARQTWLLFGINMLLNIIDWFFGLVLNIGNPATESIPIGTRIVDATLQAVAVRSSGYQTVSISSLVPAIQVLYVIMMYIAIYPIAMSVRSTNVYEENSLGIYEDEDDDSVDEAMLESPEGKRVSIWGKYLLRHARRQLAFDMWWLALSLFLICIIERPGIMNTDNASWFTVFAILFEIVSAYGTVGLSLGLPYANYSLSGAFHTLSKLIIILVMLRGRHRGLPVALDRAVLLPHDFHAMSNQDQRAASPHVPPEEQTVRATMNASDDLQISASRTRPRVLSFAVDQRPEINEDPRR